MKAKQDSRPGLAPEALFSLSSGRVFAGKLAQRLSRDHARIGPRGPWLVGFSHGADSTALLLGLVALSRTAPELVADLIAVHVDHGLHAQAAEHARRAEICANELAVPFELVRLELHGASEARARAARYEAFAKLAREHDASACLLAQHRDDNVETVLFRLLRGTGPLGLAGIPRLRPLRGSDAVVYRPMLALARQELIRALEDFGLDWAEDPSNADPLHASRNRLRHGILRELRRRDPDDRGLRRLRREAARLLRSVEAELEELHFWIDHAGVEIDVEALRRLSRWAAERACSEALIEVGREAPPRRRLAEILRLSEAGVASGKRCEALGHWRVTRRRSSLRFEAT